MDTCRLYGSWSTDDDVNRQLIWESLLCVGFIIIIDMFNAAEIMSIIAKSTTTTASQEITRLVVKWNYLLLAHVIINGTRSTTEEIIQVPYFTILN